jgi:hypothetical protein
VYANQFAGSDNAIPFWPPPTKYQQVFSASEFPSAYAMAGLGLRRNNGATVEVDGALVSIEIKLGYTTRGPGTLSPVFADNFDSGAPVTVLPLGLVEFPPHPAAAATDPAVFDVVIPFKTTFAYAPAPNKNVLIQITQSGSSMPGYTYVMDAGGSSTTARLFGSPDTATTGTLEGFNYGLVMNLYELTHTAKPLLASKESPQIGNDFPVTLAQARPLATAVLLLGTSNTSWSGLPLPLGLGAYGAPGCELLTSVNLTSIKSVKADGTAKSTYTIPLSLGLLGVHFYNQWVVLDPGANAWGFAFSNAGAGVIGS